MGPQLSSPSIISSKGRSRLWMMLRCSPFFSDMAMANIHFLPNSTSSAMSSIGMSEHMKISSVDLDKTAPLKKSNSPAFIPSSP